MSTAPRLPPDVLHVGDGFWNVRGSFEIGGVLDVGTQMSLVRLANGRYVALDAYAVDGAAERWLDEQTGGGDALEAFLHVHPFHTLHVRALHERYPHARLYGTARHHARFADLPWEDERTEDPALHARYADDLDFSVPRGVELIPDNENLHFASVLVFHRASRTLHVDDTLTYLRLPKLLRWLARDVLRFHPTLGRVLEPRAGAVRDFRDWAGELIERAQSVDNLCAAHVAPLLARDNDGDAIAPRIVRALDAADRALRRHERRYG